MSDLSASAQKVQESLTRHGVSCDVIEMPASTRTAIDAAKAIGCEVAHIAKSLLFRTQNSHRAILVIASGSNRVKEDVITALLGEPLEKADADFVREKTGFTIGGIPPIGHLEQLQTFVDRDLMQFNEIWAAAGTPNAVFRLTPEVLIRITAGRIVSVK